MGEATFNTVDSDDGEATPTITADTVPIQVKKRRALSPEESERPRALLRPARECKEVGGSIGKTGDKGRSVALCDTLG